MNIMYRHVFPGRRVYHFQCGTQRIVTTFANQLNSTWTHVTEFSCVDHLGREVTVLRCCRPVSTLFTLSTCPTLSVSIFFITLNLISVQISTLALSLLILRLPFILPSRSAIHIVRTKRNECRAACRFVMLT
ncbi:hypothetical protein EJ08DRAFT_420334 [Tothia fuscella]|uniref:Uncharacterized protein n=1 Tax=Tothia fuscella TaxID=1048955 RepID=A0A9P4NJE4_9PEZI|nr:hypothetical protein EJ08DRAFT_420334 [Tothia fuscella]